MGSTTRALDLDSAAAGIAADQWGLITRLQALVVGLSAGQIRRRVTSGTWIEILPRVYRIRGAPHSWEQRVMATVLWSGGIASHRCAAGLRGWDGVSKGFVEVLVTKNLKPRKGIVFHRVKDIPPFDMCKLRGIPATGAARTLLDLGSALAENEVELALEHALRLRDVTLTRLRWQVRTQGRPGKRGTTCLKRLLAQRPDGYRPKRSQLEVRTLRSLRRGGFPEPVYEHQVVTPDGHRLRPDFAYPEKKIAIECESYTYHGGRKVWLRDIKRYRMLRRMGWTVIQVTQEDLADEADFHLEVRQALAA